MREKGEKKKYKNLVARELYDTRHSEDNLTQIHFWSRRHQ